MQRYKALTVRAPPCQCLKRNGPYLVPELVRDSRFTGTFDAQSDEDTRT